MDDPPSLTFQSLFNGAYLICFLDGHPDLLHVRKLIRKDQTQYIRVVTYKDGKECKLFETEASRDKDWRFLCNGNTMSITYPDSNAGTVIIYENGFFRAENITSMREGLECFVRAGVSDYFDYRNDLMVMTSNSIHASLEWKFISPSCRTYSVHVVGQRIAICQNFDKSSTVVAYEFDKGAYREIGDVFVPFKDSAVTTLGAKYILLLGASEIAVIDCTHMANTRFTFTPVPGNVVKVAARCVGNDTAEIYFSARHLDQCSIYKTSLPLQVLKARIESERLAKSVVDLTNLLKATEISEETLRTENEYLLDVSDNSKTMKSVQRNLALEAEKSRVEKEIVAMKEAETASNSTVANLQATLETLERKYNTVLLMVSQTLH